MSLQKSPAASKENTHSAAVGTINIRDVMEPLDICEANIRGRCPQAASCSYHHYSAPYLWQLHLQDRGWQNLIEESVKIEKAYCNQQRNLRFQTQVTSQDGTCTKMDIEINFQAMKAQLKSVILPPGGTVVDIQRLSTASYMKPFMTQSSEESNVTFLTQWRWYWWNGDHGNWKLFDEAEGTPMQQVIEAKYLSKQDVFRFEEKKPPQSGSKAATSSQHRTYPLVFLLNYHENKLVCLNNKNTWKVLRRPLFIDHGQVQRRILLSNPPIRRCAILQKLPEEWYPTDPDQQYELVPLNPASVAYHLVASEFHSTLPTAVHQVVDVFRVQNPFLWHQFSVKKTLMQNKNPEANLERQLFHGTSQDSVTQAICRENFDWRVCGKNNIVFGKGSYFAKDAAYSHKFTGSSNKKLRWMFLARVLVGKYTKGKDSFVRPPPLDPAYPNGELYDSCVNDVSAPIIYVIFEKDQCYPEYLVSYTDKS